MQNRALFQHRAFRCRLALPAPYLFCALITLVALLVLERAAPRLGLLDRPGGHKTHALPTPVIGGLGMALGLFLTWTLSSQIEPGVWIASGGLALVLLGVHDDRHGVRARRKLIAQALIVTAVLVLDGGVIRTLGELVPGRPLGLAMFSLPLTVFAMLGLINAVNMLDGIDGLAGKVCLVAFGWFAAGAAIIGSASLLASALAIVAVLVVFLAFNARLPGRASARMFMGDTGSMLLGYLLTWMAIEITHRPGGALPPIAALWICALPILDTTAVTIRRLSLGLPPMAAGRDHLHHLLRARGLSVGRTALAEAGIGAACGLAGVGGWLLGTPDWVMFGLFGLFALAYIGVFQAAWDRQLAKSPPAPATGAAIAVAASSTGQPV